MKVTRYRISVRVNVLRIYGDAVGILPGSRLPIGESATGHARRSSHATTNTVRKEIVIIGRSACQPG